VGSGPVKVRALVALGLTAGQRGEYAGATRLLPGSLARARQAGDGAGTVYALAGLGDVAHRQGDGARAAPVGQLPGQP
jgi:hypothetical protein